MEKLYLNELSLEGQFDEIEDFLEQAVPLMKCLKFVYKKGGQVNKHSTFYNQKITRDKTWNDLRGMRGDKVRKMKSLLLSTTDNPPFWDCQAQLKQDLQAKYIYEGCNVSATSLAEAAEDNGMLLSFQHKMYSDLTVDIIKNNQEKFKVSSVSTLKYMLEELWIAGKISIHDYLSGRYEGTRLDFSELEQEHGFQKFESHEIRDCIQTFDKFIALDSWEMIFQDNGLHYKKYSPSSEENNWFRGEAYCGKTIDKFRCINPKRCFGYREKDIFHVLRMERDHKISDNG